MVMYQCDQCKTTFKSYQEAVMCCPRVSLVDVGDSHNMQRGLTTHEADTVHTCPLCDGLGERLWNDGLMHKCNRCKGRG